MAKKLCKIVKKKVDGEFVELVNNPKVVCTKCGRLSNNKDNVCKSKKISEFVINKKGD